MSDTQIENLKEKLYRGTATRAASRRLGDEIARVYGFLIPRRQAPVQGDNGGNYDEYSRYKGLCL